MIIVRLMGGLGNQMFQYAAGRRLSHVLGADLKLDITAFNKTASRKFELSALNITASMARRAETCPFAKTRWLYSIPYLPRRFIRNRRYIKEKHFHFDKEILFLPDNVYLDGYWQSEKYFADISDIIRSEFTAKTPLTGANRDLSAMITSCDSVSIHIRRGDYMADPQTHNFHGVCTLEYYYSCIKKISEHIEHPHFFLFSDDPQWARKNLKIDCPVTVIDHNGPENAYEDMRLMYTCKHHIIANSSFGWWGAWLCRNQGKIVYAPGKWFADAPHNAEDLLPAGWIRV